MEGHDFFCEVDRSFIESRFNLYGIQSEVSNFNDGLNIILDYVSSDSSSADDWNRDDWSRKEWMDLYGRIHARFILTARGQQLMLQKLRNEEFGRCPRVYCEGHPVLPVGLSDTPGKHRVMTYCPKCQDVFIPPNTLAARYVDGAYFGTTFPHFFLMQYPDHVPPRPERKYTPRVFGYRIHKSSPSYQLAASTSGTNDNASNDVEDDVKVPKTSSNHGGVADPVIEPMDEDEVTPKNESKMAVAASSDPNSGTNNSSGSKPGEKA